MKNLLPKEQGMVTIEFDERNAVFTLKATAWCAVLSKDAIPTTTL